jgi:hypothetical protein
MRDDTKKKPYIIDLYFLEAMQLALPPCEQNRNFNVGWEARLDVTVA